MQISVPGPLTQEVRSAVVAAGAAAPELAVDCLVCEKVRIYQVFSAGPRLLGDSVLQDIALHVTRSLVSTMKPHCNRDRHTLVCSMGAPKLSSIKLSPVKGSEGSRGEDGISAGVV